MSFDQSLNAQALIRQLGIPIETLIPLPYGLMLKISIPNNINSICKNHNEVVAVEGFLSVCQGVLITLSEAEVLDLAAAIVVANPDIGTIVSIRDLGFIEMAARFNKEVSIEGVIMDFLNESGMLRMLDVISPIANIQFLEFEDLVPLWWKIVNSKMIYVLKEKYHVTDYSMLSGLDGIASKIFGLTN